MPTPAKNETPAAVPPPVATICRIVQYRLSDVDAEAISAARGEADKAPKHAWGSQTHVGNAVAAGDPFPAMVVRTFGSGTVNLQVFLDGSDTYWVTSRSEGDGDGQWSWPARA